MSYSILTPPAIEPVSLNEAKEFLRITHDLEDSLLKSFIQTAREIVEQSLRQILIHQRILIHLPFDLASKRMRLMQGRTAILMPVSPLKEIHEIYLWEMNGQKMKVTPKQYHINLKRDPSILIIEGANGMAIDIECSAGYGDTPEQVPASLRHLILKMVLHLYENRNLEGPLVSEGMQKLMAPFRRRRLI